MCNSLFSSGLIDLAEPIIRGTPHIRDAIDTRAAAPTQTLGPQALRRALGGRWLYIFGDSSTRGLAISLYQHLGTARIDVAVDDGAWTMNESAWFATSRGSRLLAWLDVIVDAHGRPRHIKTSMKTTAGAFPQGDRSADLAKRWMVLRARGCVRLTWRFNTFAAKLKAEAFSELRGTPPLDYHVLQLGSWDDEARTALPLYEQQLRTGLQRWATAAVIASRPVSPVLAFSTTVVPMRQMQRDAPCGLDQQRLWYKHKQEIAALTKLRARFLNRVSSGNALHSSLGARCACLSHEQRAEVLRQQRVTGRPFGLLAEEMFGVDPRAVERAWAAQYAGYAERIDLDTETPSVDALRVLEPRQAWQFAVLPLRIEQDELVLATTEEHLARALRFAGWRVPFQCRFAICDEQDLSRAIEQHYPMAGLTTDAMRSLRLVMDG